MLRTPDLIRKYNYPAEIHDVLTEDGYILEVHRIANPGKTPVYLQHGFVSSSGEFVLYGSKTSAAFLLHDAGYDVWMSNHRGNRYSKRHVKLKMSDPKFWDFTLTELGKYDVKATIDYIINTTLFDKIHYVGNSQGNPVMVILLDDKPEYSDKLISIQGLAPAVYFEHLTSPAMRFLLNLFMNNKAYFEIAGGFFFPNMVELGYGPAIYTLCKDGTFTQQMCVEIIKLTVGPVTSGETNITRLPVLFGHFPSGVSIKQALHMAQFAVTGEFKKYDYGEKENLKVYGSKKPPFYDIKKTRVKYSIYHSSNDLLVVNKDVERFHSELPMPHMKYLCDDFGFNHADFTACTHCDRFYKERVLPTMKIAENNNL
ncbi:lipase 1-like [Condylostylus longicornis]|uniref:lipase 1-like n=1 Tax=Condylostylus longicornis TaxID=2530218 RepID=UPI00244E0C66|nr:lipase 1-like [Condylostylus longicornis]